MPTVLFQSGSSFFWQTLIALMSGAVKVYLAVLYICAELRQAVLLNLSSSWDFLLCISFRMYGNTLYGIGLL